MRIIVLVMFLLLIPFSVCIANNTSDSTSLKKAYSLYAQGKMESAIEIMEDYVKRHPDPNVLYFIGYSYYELKKMDTAMKYFRQAYLIDPDFSPMAGKGN
ncbi:MAG: tetratricopeptide repeat protein [Thermodesulfovibrionia bacterium]